MVQAKLRIKTTGIDHVVLWVKDLERSKRFYIDLLGMTIAHESEWQTFLWCGTQQIALFDATRRDHEIHAATELNHMALLMEPASYEEAKARIEEEGITTRGRQGDPTCLYFDDPDGHGLQLLYKGHDD
ncbi:MAG: VOC family protein [Chloroflexi bacterium]|nr:VOC family protein [Chloroflexota bacterium]